MTAIHAPSVQDALSAIARLNPLVNAVIRTDPSLGSGAGVSGEPILIKDCLDVQGLPTTNGSSIFGTTPAANDCEVVRRVRQAGYVIVGKANLTEFCFGATGDNAFSGRTKNPWDPARISGGSSSGSAAAVASGMVRLAIATDTGGSTRVPAALCGVVGLRPTLGRVSNRGAFALSLLCDTIGPIAPTVAEVATVFAAIAGYDPLDPVSIAGDPQSLSAMDSGVRGLRIGLPRAFYFENLQREVGEAVDRAASVLEGLGATLVDIDLEDPKSLAAHRAFQFVLADVADARRDLMRDHRDQISAEVRRRIELGEQVTGRDYAQCMRALWRFKRELRSLFADRVDLLLTPTISTTAPLWADSHDMVESTRQVAKLTYDLGAAGVPSMTVPCGLDKAGLPIGMQIVASWGEEGLLFRVGNAYQKETGHPAMPDMSRPGLQST